MNSPRFCSKLMSAALALLAGALIFSVLLPVPAGPEKTYAGVGPPPAKPAPDFSLGASPRITVEEAYGRLPLYFIENRGQVDRRVNLYAQAGGQTVWFTRDGVCFSFGETTAPKRAQEKNGRKTAATEIRQPKAANREYGRGQVVRLTPLGMSPKRELLPLEPQEARVNYLRGNNPDTWRTDIPTYRAVLYREAYPGIDLKFYGAARQLEYDIIVKPGADPGQVRFRYAGIRKLEITGEGDLAIKLPGGRELLQKKPLVYQEIGGQRVAREAKFRIHLDTARQVYGFEVAAYDPRYPLVIDPLVLVYSTFLGGTLSEASFSIAVDGSGCAYVTGDTYSTGFPTKDPYQGTRHGSQDAFVSKFDSGGSLVFSTFLGGSAGESGHGIAVDGAGSAYVTGSTSSDDFPTQTPYQGAYAGGGDAFVTKFSPDGQSLSYSTYLGGSLTEQGHCIAVDGSGSAYASGWTTSLDFPTLNAFQSQIGAPGYWDLYVTKFSPDGQSLVYSTYLGGNNHEYVDGSGLAVDGRGCAYVTGYTYSHNFPLKNPYQGSFLGVLDTFVTKFSPGGDSLVYSTYLGGEDQTFGQGIAVDSHGCAYVTGHTDCSNFPTRNAYQGSIAGAFDAFVTKLSLAATNTPALSLLLLD